MLCAALVFLTACLLAACAGSPPTTEGGAGGGAFVLRVATSFKIQNLDPVRPVHYFLVEYGVAELPLTLDENNHINP